MSTATLAGIRATHARLSIPAWGLPWADVSLDAEASLSGPVTLQIADLSVQCKVASGGPAKGKSYYRVAAGLGWTSSIGSKSYANDAGVKAATVLQDAASAAGESIDASTLPTTRLGPAYVREAAPASRVLERIAPQGWYVGEDGITRIGRRAAVDLTAPAQLGEVDLSRGSVTLAAEQIATLVPGIRAGGIEAVDVIHDVSADMGLRTTLYGNAPTSRRRDALRRLILQLLPDYKFRGLYEYRVVSLEGERYNLQPVRTSLGMPDLRRAHLRPGIPGCRADVPLGARVLVGFVDGDAGRPVVLAFEEPDGDGFAPDRLDLVGEDDAVVPDPIGRVIRYGDVVTVGTQTGAAGYSVGPASRVRA